MKTNSCSIQDCPVPPCFIDIIQMRAASSNSRNFRLETIISRLVPSYYSVQKCRPMPYNAVQCCPMPYNAVQCCPIPSKSVHWRPIPSAFILIPSNSVEFSNPVQFRPIPSNSVQFLLFTDWSVLNFPIRLDASCHVLSLLIVLLLFCAI